MEYSSIIRNKYINLCFDIVYVGGRDESAFTRNRIIKTAHEGVE